MTKRSVEGRTTLITAAGIGAVILAGAFAVGANLGILDASSDDQIGTLAAAGDLEPPAAAAQTFLVDAAGTVGVAATADGVLVTGVEATPGWEWSPGASDSTRVQLNFTDGQRSLVFNARRGADGGIAASVDDVTSGSRTSVTSSAGTDDDADEHEEEHEDGHEDGEHEGRDDDD